MGKDVFCRNFILCAVATFWAMSLVGIYSVRASLKVRQCRHPRNMAHMNKQKLEAAAIIAFLILYKEQRMKKKKRRCWVKPWKTQQWREAQGLAQNLVKEL